MYMYVYLKNCGSPLGPQLKKQVKLQTPQIAASLLLSFPILVFMLADT